jgi:hypothetical protein
MHEPRLLALGDRPVRLLLTIHLANILAMVGMNTLTLPGSVLPLVYAAGLAVGWALVGRLGLGAAAPVPLELGRWERLCVDLGFVLIVGGIALSRVSYLTEPWLGQVIEPVCWDDWFHLQDISSLTNTERFPPTSAMRPDRYLSIYYAPWMFIGFLHKAVPLGVNTLKISLAAGIGIHVLLSGYTVVYLSRQLAQRRSQFLMLCYLFLAYAGFESVFILTHPGAQLEWWTRWYGVDVHLPSWPQQLLWVMHHLSATLSTVLAAWVFTAPERDHRVAQGWRHHVVPGLLLVHALFSSAFVVIGALPIGIVFVLWRVRSRWRGLMVVLGVATTGALSTLWIYLGKDTKFVFGKHVKDLAIHQFGVQDPTWDWILSFGRFVGLEALDLVGYLLLLGLGVRSWMRDKQDRVWVALGVGFLITIFFVSFSGIDNLAARGVMIPLVVLGWVAAKHVPEVVVRHPLGVLVMVALAMGTINDLAIFHGHNLNHPRQLPAANTWDERIAQRIYAVNADRKIKTVDFGQLFDGRKPREDQVWQVERVLTGPDRPINMPGWERTRELSEERTNPGPSGPWSWQDWRRAPSGIPQGTPLE